ncbi:helix-turn-helix domain-containing protein [Streptacidiphilus sp. N1-12]|uniref:Helix-turn-helix domain-containing protein n=2 Tax=Streptacidiphilus alkalitolerans TaxID=3342712 RepID=A0ABV6VCG6_9ACTN
MEAERVYRAMLAHPKENVAALGQRLQMPETQLHQHLYQLNALALIQPSVHEDIGFRAIDPEPAMEVLLTRQQVDLAAQQMRVEASRAAAARLIAECSNLPQRAADPDSQRLNGPEEIRAQLERIAAETCQQIMTFAPGGAHTEADLAASREPNRALLERGVAMRTVYLDSARNHQTTLDHVEWLSRHGGQVRTAPTLPIRMIISDRRRAVLPIDTADARAGAVVLEGVGTVTALCALFESIWDSATPLGAPPARDIHGMPPQQAETMRLLAQGLTDEAIAKRLGVSPRTARRIAAELLNDLEAHSRFQAGVHAVQNGWLPPTR